MEHSDNLCRVVTAGKYLRSLFRQCATYEFELMDDIDENIEKAQELLIQTGFLKNISERPKAEPSTP